MSRRPPPASSFYGGRDQYGGGAYGGRAMGFGDYSRMQSEFGACVSNSVSLVCVSTCHFMYVDYTLEQSAP